VIYFSEKIHNRKEEQHTGLAIYMDWIATDAFDDGQLLHH
jgi:hypothetical protein